MQSAAHHPWACTRLPLLLHLNHAHLSVAFARLAQRLPNCAQGELTSSVVNAPMVAPEVLKELQPFVALADGLGRAAVQLVSDQGFSDVHVTYHSPRGEPPPRPYSSGVASTALLCPLCPNTLAPALSRPPPTGDDLDTRLLRAMVIKGILEQITTSQVNIVNADLLAKKRGLRIVETVAPSDGAGILDAIDVALGSKQSKFSSAVDPATSRIAVSGATRMG